MLFNNKRLFDSVDTILLGIIFLLNDFVNYYVVPYVWHIVSIGLLFLYLCWTFIRLIMLRKSYNKTSTYQTVPNLWYILDVVALVMYLTSIIIEIIFGNNISLLILDTVGIFCGIYMVIMSIQNFQR